MFGFIDATNMLVTDYGSDNFVREMEDAWKELRPLYEKLHGYVRYKLHQK